jgi:LuxR family transcriptional regulator, maltose regulon positive regulatory protein
VPNLFDAIYNTFRVLPVLLLAFYFYAMICLCIDRTRDPVKEAPMPFPLLATKLYFPPVRADQVLRPRLTGILERGLRGRLTLISAPAGSGKTSLMSEWHAHSGEKVTVAWLSLDSDDNDPLRFLTYFSAALESAVPSLTGPIISMLQSTEPPGPDFIASALLERLGTLPIEFVLAFDDHHLINNIFIHDFFNRLLSHPLPALHIAILTRADPPLPLARMRVRNELVEIRANDLRFTVEEVEAFFSKTMRLLISTDQAVSLEMRTEGWIAGLQMAALSMQGSEDVNNFINSFKGSHRYVVDYLIEEVLDRQSEVMRDFLLETSILERMNAALCNAVTGKEHGQSMLEKLEQANLFVVRLDNERLWYRYHHLFADVLQNRLRQSSLSDVNNLHCRAADWLEKNQYLPEALRHALACGDKERAGRIAEQKDAQLLARGERVALLNWLQSVEELVPIHPMLSIDKAWALILTGQPAQVDSLLKQAEGLIPNDPTDARSQHMRGNIAAIRCYQANITGDASSGLTLGKQALQILPESDAGTRGVVHLAMASAHVLLGEYENAIQLAEQASHLGKLSGNIHVAILAKLSMANLLMALGQNHRSVEMYRQALPLAVQPDGEILPIAAHAYSGLSRLMYEWNDLNTAQDYAQKAFYLGQNWGAVDTLVTAHVMLARIRQAYGDEGGAEESISAAENLVRTRQVSSSGPGWVEMARVWLWLAQGNREACNGWLKAHANLITGQTGVDGSERLILARIQLSLGDHEAAMQIISQLLHESEAAGHTGAVIELLVFQALVWQQRGEIASAMKVLERALDLAAPEGYVRVFLDQGMQMKVLLRQLKVENGDLMNYTHKLLAFFDCVPSVVPSSLADGSQPLIDPLSGRELEVLRLVAAGKSNHQIADELFLATGTVKKHLNNIFGKLGVQNRTGCVAQARELHLL